MIQLVSGLSLPWQVFFLSMFPITELRAAIPYGVAQGLSPYLAFGAGVAGNILVAIPILVFLQPAIDIISRVPKGKKLVDVVLNKTRSKGEGILKYGALGLTIFVCIPLPGTGVWTGSLLAYLFGMSGLKAFPALSMGAMLAGVIVTLLSVGAVEKLGLSAGVLVGSIVAVFLAAFIGKLLLGKRSKSGQ